MKLRHLPLIAAIGLFSTVTLAAGYTGPGATPTTTTVKAALEAADDTPVVLQGTIVKRIKGDIYEFRDATGSMKVEIDDEDFRQDPGQADRRSRPRPGRPRDRRRVRRSDQVRP